jgi:hypothetical protein
VKIDLVTLEQGPDQSHVVPPPLTVAASQLASLNAINETTSAFPQWFTRHGAVATDNLLIQLVVQGNRTSLVRIVNMRPVVSCHPPLTGTLFYSPSAGADTSTQILLNLDQPLAPSRYIADVNGSASGGTNFFQHFTVSLRHNEQYTFLVNTFTGTQYCEFTLAMTVLEGGRTVTETVGDGGRPFQVTAIENEDSARPGAFSGYRELYVGGVATSGVAGGSGHNQFGDPLWLPADPTTFVG